MAKVLFGNDRQWIDTAGHTSITASEDQLFGYDVHLRAAGDEGVDAVLREEIFEGRRELGNVTKNFNLVDQLVNQILILIVREDDVFSSSRPLFVRLKQAELARAS